MIFFLPERFSLLCGSKKINIHTPPRRKLEIPRGWGLGVRGRGNSRGEGGLDDIIQFQGVNSVQKLVLTDMVDHF